MTCEELLELIAEVQRHQTELDDVEVKAAKGGTPRRIYETLSAFANRPSGGVILFGLDEQGDFSIVGVGNPHRLQEEVSHVAAAEMEPALRPEFTVEEVESKTVVAVEVPGISNDQKPCYYKPAGLPGGLHQGGEY
jgi:ATP-dependent DNA helicase RecG